jgi:mRNA interferase MazF
VIKQGDIYWLDLSPSRGSEPAFRRPVVVVQSNKFNKSAINTTVVCTVTTNLLRAQAPGNVLISKGDGGLKKQSVVNISQIVTINKNDLAEKLGALKPQTTLKIIEGLELLFSP